MGLSRNEDILQSIVDGTQYTDPPKSRVEDLLLQVKEAIEEGGGGGTDDYDDLNNRPQIGGVTLSGNKSAADLSLASLDANGKVPAAQLPSYVDDVINGYLYEGHFYEDSAHTTEITGESGKIYVDLETNKTYRWSGLAFVEISESLALGETASTAYAGDKGKANADAITAIKDGQTIDSFGDVESALANKVDKVNGKGLSTNDYTDADKAIVGGVTAALAGKQDALTAGNNIKMENDAISVNRWFIPAGKVVYTIITSDENYGQNVHIQRHTFDGAFIDDRTFLCEMYKTVTIDDLISIWNPYSEYRITLLKDSDEHQSGYSYTVNPITTPTSNSFTFLMEQEENDNDLIIREELDAVSSAVSAIKDGQSIDSFADVETALAGKQATLTFDSAPTDGSTNPVESNGVYDALALKQNATDNNLQTTDKTVVGAINEHEGDIGSLKSGLIDVADDVKLNTQDLTTPSRTKNLLEIQNESRTIADVTYTVNADGTITANGTATGTSIFAFYTSKQSDLGKNYIISGCHNGSASTYKLQVHSDTQGVIADDIGSGVTFNASSDFYVRIVVYSGTTLSNVVFDPMLRLASETDPTFAPYIPSVESRIDAVESGLDDVQSGIMKKSTVISETNAIGNAYNIAGVICLAIYDGGQFSCNANDVIFTLPVGFRPSADMQVVNTASGHERILINSSGQVIAKEAFNNSYARFTITFI